MLKALVSNVMDEESLYNFCHSSFWDNNLTWYTDYPRFTPCFEKTVLVWIPCGFLWLASGVDIYNIFISKTKNIPWNWRNKAKLMIIALLIALCIFDFFYHVYGKIEVFLVGIYTPIIKFFSLVLCSSLVILHRKYGRRSSGLLFIFWFLIILFGFSQFYADLESLLLSDKIEVIQISYTAYYCLSFGVFLLHWITDLPPASSEYPSVKNPCKEESASFPSRLTFSWFNPLLHQGFRKTLVISDLWSVKYQDTASQVFLMFDEYWRTTLIKNNGLGIDKSAKFLKNESNVNISRNEIKPYKQSSIVFPLCKAFGTNFLVCSTLKLIQIFLSFVSPELLKCLIEFIEGNEPQWHGYLYAISLLVFSTLQLLFMTQYAYRAQVTGLKIKTALTMAIYRKALKLSNSSRKESTLGEIVNLMAVDAQRFYQLITSLNNLWSFPIQITLAVLLLWQSLGPSVLAGLAILVIMIPINGYIVNRAKGLQVKQMKYKDERIKMMNEIISGIKVLKLYAWESSFEERVLKIRKKEADLLKKAAILKAFISFIWSCAPFLVSLVTFATYVLIDESHILDTSKAFVSLALFNILRPPLTILPMVISNVIQAGVSVKRINKFLNSEELDPNGVTHGEKDEKNALMMENGSFSWEPNNGPTLCNLNLEVSPGSLVAVVGAVGSGKSSLISAFLGGMYKLSGRVATQGSIAYVPQLAWIQNCTLQNNILFGRNLDDRWYNEVIAACGLKQDLEMLPGGDQTEIGERGINLSGGQKQRVSLARAVYSDSDIYFLDDPLSSVDSHVGKHIFENVIGSRGILRRKTRLFITHSITYLPDVDLVVVLKDGTVSEVGTYLELLDKKGAFGDFILTYLHGIGSEESEDIGVKMNEHVLNINPDLNSQLTRQISVNSSSSTMSLRNRRISINSPNCEGKKDKHQKLVKEEKSEVGKVKWIVYSHYLQAIGSIMFSATIILTVLRQVFSVGSNILLSEWSSDKNLFVNGTQDTSKRNIYLGVYGLLGAGETITTFFSSIFWFLGATNAGTFLHFILLINIMRCPMSFFDATPQGRIISRFAKDIDIIDNIIPSSMKQLLSFVSGDIGTLLVITYSIPIFVAVMIPIGLLFYFIQRYYVATSQQLKRLESVSRSPVYSHFGETVSGTSVIRAYGAQKRFIRESEEKIDFNQVCTYPSIIASRWLTIRLQMLGNMAVFFCALFSVISKDSLSPGIVALSLTYALQITQSLSQLASTSAEVETNIVAVERIKEYGELPQEAAWDINPSPITADWPQEGKVEFIDYKFRYREELELVLKGINLVINGGEKIGIVGRTGAGKSSVTLGLFRIIESAGGKILIDGIDISILGLHSLRSRIAIIPQDPVLFSGSLRMNVDPFGIYSDEQVWRAIELAHLKPFVQSLPAGLQHEVTECGENMSVGQRQLICLARTLLCKTKILILDEATSAVDLETDDFIQKTIQKEFTNCTVLTVAHRINTIMDSDRILVLDKGSVVEFDAPDVLLRQKSSVFYGMAHDAGLL